MPVQCAPPDRGDASVPPPHRATPAPTRLAGALQKPTSERGLGPTTFQRRDPLALSSRAHNEETLSLCHPERIVILSIAKDLVVRRASPSRFVILRVLSS